MIKKISKLHPCHLGAHDTKTEDVDLLANGEHPISNREMSMYERASVPLDTEGDADGPSNRGHCLPS